MKQSRNTLLVAILLAATLLLGLAGCATTPAASTAPSAEATTAAPTTAAVTATPAAAATELMVAAAASLTDVMPKLAEAYAAVAPDVTLTFTFGSSGTLQTQIEEGAPVDLFFSAGKKQMTALNDKGLLLEGTNTDLLENKIVLIVPADSTLTLTGFEDLTKAEVKLVALGEASVPVGQYSEQLLTNLGIWDTVKAKTNFGTDVRQVLTWVENGEVDCGIVYKSDALVSGDKIKVVADAPEGSLDKVICPAAVIKTSKSADAAKAFLEFLSTPEASAIFDAYGFTPLAN